MARRCLLLSKLCSFQSIDQTGCEVTIHNSNLGVIREELVVSGGHDEIMSHRVVTLALTRICRDLEDEALYSGKQAATKIVQE